MHQGATFNLRRSFGWKIDKQHFKMIKHCCMMTYNVWAQEMNEICASASTEHKHKKLQKKQIPMKEIIYYYSHILIGSWKRYSFVNLWCNFHLKLEFIILCFLSHCGNFLQHFNPKHSHLNFPLPTPYYNCINFFRSITELRVQRAHKLYVLLNMRKNNGIFVLLCTKFNIPTKKDIRKTA